MMSKNAFLLLLFCLALVSLLCLTASAHNRRGPQRQHGNHQHGQNQHQKGNREHHQREQEHRDHLVDPKAPQGDQPAENQHHQDQQEHRDHLVDPQAERKPEDEQEEEPISNQPAEEVEPETPSRKQHHPAHKEHKKDHHGKKHDSDDDDDEEDDDDDDEKGDEHGKNRHQLLKNNCSVFFKQDLKKKHHQRRTPVVHCVKSCEWLNENFKELYHDKEQKKDHKNNGEDNNDQKYSTHVVINPEFSVSKCVDNTWKCPANLIPEVECTTPKGCNYPRPFPHAYCKNGHWKKPCWFSRVPRWVIHVVVAALIIFFFLLSSFIFIRCVHRTRAPKCKSDQAKKGKSIDSEEEGVVLVPQPY